MDHMPLVDLSGIACGCDVEHCTGTCPARRSRTLLQRVARAVQRAALRYRIRSNQRYLADCEQHGIVIGHMVDEWRWDLHEMQVRLRELERP